MLLLVVVVRSLTLGGVCVLMIISRTLLACLLFVPIDVVTTQLVLYPSEYNGVADCVKKIWRAEGWRVRAHPSLPFPSLLSLLSVVSFSLPSPTSCSSSPLTR